jgi:hypothetical protein
MRSGIGGEEDVPGLKYEKGCRMAARMERGVVDDSYSMWGAELNSIRPFGIFPR